MSEHTADQVHAEARHPREQPVLLPEASAEQAPLLAALLRPEADGSFSRRAGLRASVARRLVSLQRSRGNQYVQRRIAPARPADRSTAGPATGAQLMREPESPDAAPDAAAAPPRIDLVFLMGNPKADEFFREAQRFYKQEFPKASISTAGSLADILSRVKQSKNPIGNLVIVSHAHEDGTLQFKFDKSDPDNKLDFTQLSEANQQGTLATPDVKIVDDQTSIMIRGCNIGRSPLMLDQIDLAFGGAATVSAPTHEQHYGHDTAGTSRETFSGYFVEKPGKLTQSDTQLKPEFAARYPFVPDKQWMSLLKKKTTINDKQGPFELELAQPEAADALTVFEPFLEQQLSSADGWSFKFVKRTPNGPGFDYSFEASRLNDEGQPEKRPMTIPFTPISKQELEAEARPQLSRPDAYAYDTVKTVHDKANGVLIFQIFPERTEWIVKHTEIEDASGPLEPAEGDPDWWGESSATPP